MMLRTFKLSVTYTLHFKFHLFRYFKFSQICWIHRTLAFNDDDDDSAKWKKIPTNFNFSGLTRLALILQIIGSLLRGEAGRFGESVLLRQVALLTEKISTLACYVIACDELEVILGLCYDYLRAYWFLFKENGNLLNSNWYGFYHSSKEKLQQS